jgi:chromosome segregation ATPase
VLEPPGILDHVVNEARERREAMRQLADLRRRLEAAEGALTDALVASKRAEEAFDAASDRFDAAERALDEAREDRAQARRDRYAARQAYERASATADRLARRVRETSERLDRAAELAATLQRGIVPAASGKWPRTFSRKSSAACGPNY